MMFSRPAIKKIILSSLMLLSIQYAVAEEDSDMNKDRKVEDGNSAPEYMSGASKMQGWSIGKGIPDTKPSDDGDTDSERVKLAEETLKANININEQKHQFEISEMEKRQKVINDNQKEITDQINILYNDNEQLKTKKQRKKEDIEAGINRMARIFEQMPPRSSAAMFNVLDMRVMVPITQRMKPRSVSVIMGNMNSNRANILSQYLAGIKHLSSDTIEKMSEPTGFDVQQ